jgi:hypothetical protein
MCYDCQKILIGIIVAPLLTGSTNPPRYIFLVLGYLVAISTKTTGLLCQYRLPLRYR